MTYFLALLYISALYIRPGEIVPSLAGVPVIDYLTMVTAIFIAGALILRPRKFWDQPQDKAFRPGLCWPSLFQILPGDGWKEERSAFLQFLPVVFCYFLIRIGVRSHRQLRGVITLLICAERLSGVQRSAAGV